MSWRFKNFFLKRHDLPSWNIQWVIQACVFIVSHEIDRRRRDGTRFSRSNTRQEWKQSNRFGSFSWVTKSVCCCDFFFKPWQMTRQWNGRHHGCTLNVFYSERPPKRLGGRPQPLSGDETYLPPWKRIGKLFVGGERRKAEHVVGLSLKWDNR